MLCRAFFPVRLALSSKCVHYIRRFDGKGPLIRSATSHRMNAIRLAALINRVGEKTSSRARSATISRRSAKPPDVC